MLRNQLPKNKLLCHDGYRPSYRWCSACLAEDTTPYLRWEWRLHHVKRCMTHGTGLLEECSFCNSPLTLQRALLVSGGKVSGVPDLASCATCGMSLIEDISLEVDESDERTLKIVEQLKLHHLHGDSQLEIDFSAYGCLPDLSPQRMEASWFDMCIHRQLSRSQMPIHLSGNNFKPVTNRGDDPQVRQRWSDGLRPNDRRRLADALQVIRGERNRLRLMGLYPMQDDRRVLRV